MGWIVCVRCEKFQRDILAQTLVSPLRASPRLANSSDEHTLKKAARRAAAKNLEFLEGNGSIHPSLSFDKNVISDNLMQLGIHANSESVNSLCKTALTFNHEGFGTEENDESELDYLDSENEDSIEELEKKAIKELCGDLLEEIFDDEESSPSFVLRGSKRASKSCAKPRTKKTCRVKLFKNSLTVSK